MTIIAGSLKYETGRLGFPFNHDTLCIRDQIQFLYLNTLYSSRLWTNFISSSLEKLWLSAIIGGDFPSTDLGRNILSPMSIRSLAPTFRKHRIWYKTSGSVRCDKKKKGWGEKGTNFTLLGRCSLASTLEHSFRIWSKSIRENE